MNDGVLQFVLIFGFMLIPIWIPMIGLVLGVMSDLTRGAHRTRMSRRTGSAQVASTKASDPQPLN